jgi:HK97 family phage prohead protease
MDDLHICTAITGDDLALKFDAGNNGSFAAYASVFNNIDAHGDTILDGAYAEALRGLRSLPLLLHHDPVALLGKADGLTEDGVGLRFMGRLTLGTSLADDVYKHMRAGALDGVSVGLRIPRDGITTAGDRRTIRKCSPIEISLTCAPANKLARVDLGSLKTLLTHGEQQEAAELAELLTHVRTRASGMAPPASSTDAAVIAALRNSGIRRLR